MQILELRQLQNKSLWSVPNSVALFFKKAVMVVNQSLIKANRQIILEKNIVFVHSGGYKDRKQLILHYFLSLNKGPLSHL